MDHELVLTRLSKDLTMSNLKADF